MVEFSNETKRVYSLYEQNFGLYVPEWVKELIPEENIKPLLYDSFEKWEPLPYEVKDFDRLEEFGGRRGVTVDTLERLKKLGIDVLPPEDDIYKETPIITTTSLKSNKKKEGK